MLIENFTKNKIEIVKNIKRNMHIYDSILIDNCVQSRILILTIYRIQSIHQPTDLSILL